MTALDPDGPNAAQVAYWNESAGPTWVAMQDALDRELDDLGLAAMAALAPREGERLVDIGCGCGATTLELARRVGKEGGGARRRHFCARCSAWRASGRRRPRGWRRRASSRPTRRPTRCEPVDGAFSRFGVMFFADPVAAFANIRRGLRSARPHRLRLLARVGAEPLDDRPDGGRAAAAAGAAARADAGRAGSVRLRRPRPPRSASCATPASRDISIEPLDAQVSWGDLETSARMALRLGPVAALVRENPDAGGCGWPTRSAPRSTPHVGATGVRLDSATWIVLAK